MRNDNFNVVELFSGIGSQAKAMKNIGMKANTIGTCEWDIHAFVAYDAIHNSPYALESVIKMEKVEILEELRKYKLSNDGKTEMQFEKVLKTYRIEALRRILSAIRRSNNFVNINDLYGKDLPDGIDIMTYSFPCQDLSNVGAFHGYNKGIDKDANNRSCLLWEVGRILTEMDNLKKELPKFLLLENVSALLSKRHKNNFNIWKSDLEKLGYVNHIYKINSNDFGLPQNRYRLIMISVLIKDDEKAKEKLENYYITHNLESAEYIEKLQIEKKTLKQLLRIDYNNPILFEEAKECQPNDTASRRTIWENNPKIVDENQQILLNKVATLTTKQDRHPNSGNLYFDYKENTKSKFRYLTPRECFLLMGFDEYDFERVPQENPEFKKGQRLFPRDKLIRMAGNSIPVNLLEQIFIQIRDIDSLLKC